MRSSTFLGISVGAAVLLFVLLRVFGNDYLFFAGYTVLQFIVLATAWNILGGYCGYVNFGTAAFFALGAYTSVFFHKTYQLPIPVLLVIAAGVSGLVGLGTGYLTLRLRGAFFAIATLALAVVLQTMVVNWNFVGGSRGAYVIRPNDITILGFQIGYIEYLFLIMALLAAAGITAARAIERSKLGYGFATIRDDELAAEASGVPTLKLKLIATTLSGALMGMAGAPFPYYIGYLEPASAFGLPYAVNSIAMPMIGGTTSWIGPLVGALLLGTLQQIVTVTISSVVNLLIVGFLLVGFVIIAPNGIVGLLQEFLRTASPGRVDVRSIGIILFAIYAFVAGLLGIVFSLAVLTGAGSVGMEMAAAGFVVAALYLVSAYGLMKIQSWSPLMASVAFALSIPIAA
ncbi:MAG TPA: branched-chain amino acid ABC transporter permease, partial [Xanthobacteraceae bacterium]